MIYRIRRFLLGLAVAFLFLYLLVISAVNFSSFPDWLEHRVSKKLKQPVHIGFIYLNWKAQPALSHFRMTRPEDSIRNQDFVRIDHLVIHPDWQALYTGDYDPGEFEMVRSVYFGHLDINLDKVPDSRKLFSNLPPVPAYAPSWAIEYFQQRRRLFRVEGEDMNYSRGDGPVTLKVRSLLDQPINAFARMEFFPVTDWDFEIKQARLPEQVWPLRNNRWKGDIRFDSREDTGMLTADLAVNPGGIRDIKLPEGTLKGRIKTGPDTTVVDTLRFASKYANFDWDGTVAHDTEGNQYDLTGNLFVNVKKLGNKLLKQSRSHQFDVERAFPLNGNFRITGSGSELRTEGTMQLRQAVFNLHRPDTVVRLTMSNWAGETTGDSLALVDGSLESLPVDFNLSEGYLDWDNQNLVASLTGTTTADTWLTPAWSSLDETPLGPFQDMESRVNLSTIIGREHTEFAFAFEDGNVDFEHGGIQAIHLVTSFSSLEPIQTSFRGEFEGPDGNPWVIDGDHNDLRLRSRLDRLNRLVGLFSGTSKSSPLPLEIERAEAMIQLNNPLSRPTDYFGFVKFDGSSIRPLASDRGVNDLYGEITFTPSSLQLNEMYGKIGDGDFQLSGQLAHDTQFLEGDWDLEGSGVDIPASLLLPESYRTLVSGDLDFDGNLRGSLLEPHFRSQVSSSKLTAGIFTLKNIKAHLGVSRESFDLSSLQAQLGGGDLSINSRIVFGEKFTVAGEISDASLNDSMKEIDYFREQTQGKVDLDFSMAGPIERVEEWGGELSLAHHDVVLKEFPEIPGLEKVASSEALEKEISIHDQTQVFPIRNGKLRFEPLNLVAEGLELNGKGYLGFQGDLDSRFTLTLKEETLRGYLQDVLGDIYRDLGLSDTPRQLDIPFTIKGTVIKPQIGLDDQAITQNFRSGLIQSVIPEKLGGKLLDELFGEIFN